MHLVLPKETKTVTLPYKENNEYQISELREAAGGAIAIKTWRVRFAEIHYPNKLILFDNDLVWVNFEGTVSCLIIILAQTPPLYFENLNLNYSRIESKQAFTAHLVVLRSSELHIANNFSF